MHVTVYELIKLSQDMEDICKNLSIIVHYNTLTN